MNIYIASLSYCSWGSQGKNTEVVCHSLLQWTTFCQTSPPWPNRLGWPHMAWLSFIELDMAVVLWSSWLVFCDYGFSLSALWCPLATPTVLLGCLLSWTCGISSRPLQQSTHHGYDAKDYLITFFLKKACCAIQSESKILKKRRLKS